METTQIPNWFWIAIAIVFIATIAAVVMCNKQKTHTSTSLSDQMNSLGREDVFDSLAAMQNMS